MPIGLRAWCSWAGSRHWMTFSFCDCRTFFCSIDLGQKPCEQPTCTSALWNFAPWRPSTASSSNSTSLSCVAPSQHLSCKTLLHRTSRSCPALHLVVTATRIVESFPTTHEAPPSPRNISETRSPTNSPHSHANFHHLRNRHNIQTYPNRFSSGTVISTTSLRQYNHWRDRPTNHETHCFLHDSKDRIWEIHTSDNISIIGESLLSKRPCLTSLLLRHFCFWGAAQGWSPAV